MTTYAKLRSQVDALCRKYAAELEVYRLGKVTRQFCDEMAETLTGPETVTVEDSAEMDDTVVRTESGPPKPLLDWNKELFQRIKDRGYGHRQKRLMAVYNYLKRCLKDRLLPRSRDVLRALLPKAAVRGLIPRYLEDAVSF